MEGYTDAKGKGLLNKKMASLRANEIVKFLKLEGISADRIETVSLGAKSPEQSKNRRVELVILPEGKLEKS